MRRFALVLTGAVLADRARDLLVPPARVTDARGAFAERTFSITIS